MGCRRPPRPGGHRLGQDAPPCASACLPSNGDRNSTMSQRPRPGDLTTVPGWLQWPVGCATTWSPTLRRPRAHSLLCCHRFGICSNFLTRGPAFSVCAATRPPPRLHSRSWVPVAFLPGSRPEPLQVGSPPGSVVCSFPMASGRSYQTLSCTDTFITLWFWRSRV